MSKLQLKIKDHDNNFIVLNNIRNLRFTLRNNREEVKDISSFGWRKVLDCAGSRHITIKINGILDSVLADELLRNSAILNSNNDYEINFNTKEKIRLRCLVELYERYYDPAAFDSFTVILASAEVVNAFH
ncbi:phage tail protein [Wolbachia endosymbiont (group A) of Sympetrum striolatum]|uniref:phage tail protein n=1 Tax=Wolbachia endosymbiont (group A) of Sympetrum striolatum TaxID=2954061 RepID=UPI0022275F4C|nr:phage tail protein [Wolbachia endosymbiont (group A) of Sympetrum striolatum]